MHGARKSDRPIVPAKPPNKAAEAAEVVEGRGLAKGNMAKRNAARTQRRSAVFNELAMYVQSQPRTGMPAPASGCGCASTTRGKSPVR
jgi:hypothetical protein